MRTAFQLQAQIREGKFVLRKLMAGVVFCSVPVLTFGVAQVATTASAGALRPAVPTTCVGVTGQVITFAAPGLSDLGTAHASTTSTARASKAKLSCTPGGSGKWKAENIVATSTDPCPGTSPAPSPCPGGDYVYDAVSQLVNGASTFYQDVPLTKWKIGTTLYIAVNTGSAAAGAGSGPGLCPSTEMGFVLTGHLSTSSSTSTKITACLDTDTGPGTTGSFLNDVAGEMGGNTAVVIASSTEDPGASSIVF